MKSLSPVPDEKSAQAAPIAFLPSWLFFVENITVEASLSPNELREQVALQLESFAPIPSEQLFSGFVANASKGTALGYAAARERCRERLANLPEKTLHCLPAFALWNNADTLLPRWEWFATDEELTAVLIEPDNPFPTRIHSWPVAREGLSESEFHARLLADRNALTRELNDSKTEQKEGIYLFDRQIINSKKQSGEIRMKRLCNDGNVVSAARVLPFSLAGDAIWNADIRDAKTLSRERKTRGQIKICKRITSLCGFFAVALAIVQIFLWIFEHKTQALVAREEAQRPIAQTIRNQAKLIADISKIQENKLQTMRTVAALNASRPNGVGITAFSGNGTAGTITVAGSAENIALANEFEKQLRNSALFKNISFSANMTASGVHFNLQCTPVKSAIDALDFYATGAPESVPEKPLPAEKTEPEENTPEVPDSPAEPETSESEADEQ